MHSRNPSSWSWRLSGAQLASRSAVKTADAAVPIHLAMSQSLGGRDGHVNPPLGPLPDYIGRMTAVSRVPASIEIEEFRERFELPEVPVVIEGGGRQCPAVGNWSPSYLKGKVGHVVVPYKKSSNHQHPNFHAPSLGEMFARAESTLSELVDFVTSAPVEERAKRLFTGDERFLLQRRDGRIRRDAELAPLLDDVPLPRFVPEEQLYTIWGWISGAGVRTWLHYDNNYCHNLNAQLTGKKRCSLYRPADLYALDPFPLGGPNPAHNCSRIDVESNSQAEAFRALEAFEAEIVAGDLLFIPACWFHTFVHLGEFNTNVNFWWRPARLAHTPVVARQAFLDAAKVAGLDAKNAEHATVLQALDRAFAGAR